MTNTSDIDSNDYMDFGDSDTITGGDNTSTWGDSDTITVGEYDDSAVSQSSEDNHSTLRAMSQMSDDMLYSADHRVEAPVTSLDLIIQLSAGETALKAVPAEQIAFYCVKLQSLFEEEHQIPSRRFHVQYRERRQEEVTDVITGSCGVLLQTIITGFPNMSSLDVDALYFTGLDMLYGLSPSEERAKCARDFACSVHVLTQIFSTSERQVEAFKRAVHLITVAHGGDRQPGYQQSGWSTTGTLSAQSSAHVLAAVKSLSQLGRPVAITCAAYLMTYKRRASDSLHNDIPTAIGQVFDVGADKIKEWWDHGRLSLELRNHNRSGGATGSTSA